MIIVEDQTKETITESIHVALMENHPDADYTEAVLGALKYAVSVWGAAHPMSVDDSCAMMAALVSIFAGREIHVSEVMEQVHAVEKGAN